MSKLNINRNIFLEQEELNRWQLFMQQSPSSKAFLSNTLAWGIIDTSGGSSTPVDFLVAAGTNSGTVKIANLSRALSADGLLIEQKALDNISIPNDGLYYWMKISQVYSSEEEGTVSITTDGQLTGVNTVFTDVLRGQSTEAPVKIMFTNSAINTGVYEVVDVTDDSNAILLGTTFTAESNLTYKVIGAVPLGDTVTSQQQQGLYFYDNCQIDFVAETVADTEPAGKIQDYEFWIARVVNNSGTVTIVDKRTEYWEYYIKGVSDKLTTTNNLSDVSDVAIARSNLDVYSKGEVDNLLNITQVGWTAMNRGSAAEVSGFDIKISRVGTTCTITGKYVSVNGSISGDILASIPISTIEGSADVNIQLSTPIYFRTNDVGSSSINRGTELYVAAITGASSDLQILVSENKDTVDNLSFTVTFNLI